MKNKLKTLGLILTCVLFTSCGSTQPAVDVSDIDQLFTGMVQNMQSDMNIVTKTVNTDGSK